MRKYLLAVTVLLVTVAHASAATILKDGVQTNVPVCGGFAGILCENDQWCDYPDDGNACGVADRFGTCRPRPEVCTMEFIPVCGCNGKTYSNACNAAADGVDVAYLGECGSDR